jgi:two-component system cell cycle response regulator DivK
VTKVLYIEHDDDNLYMLKMRLERVDDFEVLAADGSERGCELAVTEHPDVILMDLEMPDSDCWEVVRRLKTNAQTGHIPIIGMSAYALDSEREQTIASGCDEFDAKPIDFEALVATIRRLVANPK